MKNIFKISVVCGALLLASTTFAMSSAAGVSALDSALKADKEQLSADKKALSEAEKAKDKTAIKQARDSIKADNAKIKADKKAIELAKKNKTKTSAVKDTKVSTTTTTSTPKPKVLRDKTGNVVTEDEVKSGTKVAKGTDEYNCSDFKTQAEAQAFYIRSGGVNGDTNHLDGNKDGLACQDLPKN